MASSFSFCLSSDFLFPLLLIMGTLGVGTECGAMTSVKPLEEMDKYLANPSECVLDCTTGTYMRKLQVRDTQTIRFKDSSAGDQGEYCWSTQIKCEAGEHLERAYILLPVDKSQLEESMGLKMTLPPITDALWPHRQQSLLPNNCGLQFDITSHFTTGPREPKLCVKVNFQKSIVGNGVLRCPPFMVTMWQKKQNHSPTNQERG
ncbi:uncharacterized protein LOC134038445 [Osmerus eperlanus]|uniref:uncharacterized protein LOC134038445 n=1 Tax=Osmerus eperlanus TaxID=29151 RepID=UPI002E10F7BB